MVRFRNRYFSSPMTHKEFDTLKQRKQSHDELVTFYIDDVVNLCREIDLNNYVRFDHNSTFNE